MAFKNGLSEHMDELRLASPRSPPSESPFSSFSSFPSPPGSRQSFNSAFQPPVHDIRSTITRRFTTDSTKFSPWSGWTPQAPPLPGSLDLLTSFEKKRQQIEYMREQRRRFEADLKLLDLQQEKEKREMEALARDLAKAGINGPVSEPTTPPEYRENQNGFPSMFSRPARFSISSAAPSSSMFSNVFTSQFTTPASKSTVGSTSNNGSALSSRRNSENESESSAFQGFRPGHAVRYSLPTSNAIGSGLNGMGTNKNPFPKSMSLDPFVSSRRLLGEDDEDTKDEGRISTPDVNSYLRLTETDDKFPTLTSREENSGVVSANTSALDFSNARTPVPEHYGNGVRHHSTHQSLPHNNFGWFNPEPANLGGFAATRHTSSVSLEGGLQGFGNNAQPMNSATTTPGHSRPGSVHMSYSMNDIPTTGRNGAVYGTVTPPRGHGGQTNGTGSGYAPTPQSNQSVHSVTPPTPQSGDQGLGHGGFTAGGSYKPHVATVSTQADNNGALAPATNPLGTQPYGYNAPQYPANTAATYPAHIINAYGPQTAAPYNRGPRRNGEGDGNAFSRYANVPLEHYRGELYGLCKDQHGCRYLQRKLEERLPESVEMIFNETNMHVVELMTDPFGNYLCQKLLESSNDEQRTVLIRNAAPHLVQIALNQHGTRALQKMIEFVSTPEQIQMVINALRNNVVELVQDLNGNHVIQKCLNRLNGADAQFIYDAVGSHCVIVGTHRHGCCVLQRCIDHASGEQRAKLIAHITSNAFALVQDPFGNYVVQYILDLSEPRFTGPICKVFKGNVPALSKQKFSSNVIEKCIRTADYNTRRALIQEMVAPNELERMLRDSFANYVVQTAIDFADPETRTKLLDSVRPILPTIRQTPHGRRIAGKLMNLEVQNRNGGNGQLTPNALLGDDSMAYPHGHALPPAMTSADESTAVIYSPIPQHGNNAINGLNGINTANFSLY